MWKTICPKIPGFSACGIGCLTRFLRFHLVGTGVKYACAKGSGWGVDFFLKECLHHEFLAEHKAGGCNLVVGDLALAKKD